MKESLEPAARAAIAVAFAVGLAMVLLDPFSMVRVGGLLTLLAGMVAVVLVAAFGAVLLSRHEMPEEEFQRIAERSEELARMSTGTAEPSEFDELVIEAIDDLPAELAEVVEEIPIVVSNRGREHRAYGHYIGDTVARDDFRDHIVIYQDTLERDFGFDPEVLRAQVTRTVRHEVAHHLGWNESGVRGLGL